MHVGRNVNVKNGMAIFRVKLFFSRSFIFYSFLALLFHCLHLLLLKRNFKILKEMGERNEIAPIRKTRAEMVCFFLCFYYFSHPTQPCERNIQQHNLCFWQVLAVTQRFQMLPDCYISVTAVTVRQPSDCGRCVMIIYFYQTDSNLDVWIRVCKISSSLTPQLWNIELSIVIIESQFCPKLKMLQCIILWC